MLVDRRTMRGGPAGIRAALALAARLALTGAGFLATLAGAAALPLLIKATDGGLALDPGAAIDAFMAWARGLGDGSSLYLYNGQTRWNFLDLAPRFCLTTYLYLAVPGIAGLAGGLAGGLARGALPRRREGPGTAAGRVPGLKRAGLLMAVPDFILTVLVQLSALALLELTGLKPFSISHDASSGLLLALPLAVMTAYPLAYAYRSTVLAAGAASASRYVEAAAARGVPERALRLRHVGTATVASLATELPAIMALMMASVFMVEYSFALPGATRWLFTMAFSGSMRGWYDSYQYGLALNILLCLALVYVAALATLRVALAAMREALNRASS